MAEDIPGRYSENYIGDESRKLFKVLSDALGDEVKKANFCWTLERAVNSPLVSSSRSPNNQHRSTQTHCPPIQS
ncbi:MAG: hypothetical protein J7525_11625 [Roseofilum sp. SID3]|uniref:hypothetical protein n=1 Tax=Roseofilum sp. SID3 TaxID=2821499 RepID=UPI001B2D822D|nr:hypothetical protein [Roseofilum sp. SID3]MBP0013745.1 hypothetical protein [Roseofilum sp. SID3]